MNLRLSLFLRNWSYSFASNFVSFLISVSLVLIVPKFIDIKNYGYWQLYLFYTSYIGFFHFGWIDGLYLKYGGYSYASLNMGNIRSQFWILNIVEFCFATFVLLYIFFCVREIDQKIVMATFAGNVLIIVPKTFLTCILLSTNRIRSYSLILLVERFTLAIGITVLLFGGSKNYQALIFADMIGKMAGILLAVYLCYKIVWGKISITRSILAEVSENIISGSKLMFANIAGMLMLGTIRFAIEEHWGVIIFGKVSMALSASNLFMIFVGALNVVLFPLLRRTSTAQLSESYLGFRSLLLKAALGMLLLYYPISQGLMHWLPSYQESYLFLALLFPVYVCESKWTILIYTYMKALRKENWILFVNIIAVGLSAVLIVLTVYCMDNLLAAILSVTIVSIIRCFLAEFLLANIIKVKIQKMILWEVLCTVFFCLYGLYVAAAKRSYYLFICIYIIF